MQGLGSSKEGIERDQKGVRVETPEGPLVRDIFGDRRAVKAVLTLLREAKVGCTLLEGVWEGEVVKGEEGALECTIFLGVVYILSFLPLSSGGSGVKGKGGTAMTAGASRGGASLGRDLGKNR